MSNVKSVMRIYAREYSAEYESHLIMGPSGPIGRIVTGVIYLSWTGLDYVRRSEVIYPDMAKREIAMPCGHLWSLISI
jgi:hypothetical protein